MSLSNLKIATRLGIALFVVLFFTALITGIGIWRLNDVAASTNEIAKVNYKQSLVQEWQNGISNNAIRAFAKVKSYNVEDQNTFQKEMDVQSERINEIQKELEPLLVTDEGKKLFQKIADTRKEYTETRKYIFKIKSEKGEAGRDEINTLVESKLVPTMKNYLGSVQEFFEWQKN